jgi:signal transduction histidine kinase
MSGRLSRAYARASGMPLLVGLLVVSFAIAADLAHEAWATAQSQQRTAERAARDFVRYAAASAADEVQATLGLALRALFGTLETRGRLPHPAPGPEALLQAAARVAECRCAPALPVRYAFRLSLGRGELRIAGDTGGAATAWLRDTVAVGARAGRQRRTDEAVSLVFRDVPRAQFAAYASRMASAGDTLLYGVVLDADAVGAAILAPVARRHVDAGRARPRQGAAFDSLMRVFLIAPNGHIVFDANPRRAEPRVTMLPRAGHETYLPGAAPLDPIVIVADTTSLGPDYGGVALEVALASTGPPTLSADGVPRSRLLVLLGLLVLMAGLVAAAVLQLRHEHELARLRADLTAGVSHELRTPLAQIMLYGETLMLDRTRSERERRAAAEVIVREARRLMHLVENALHFARADRRVLVLTPEAIDVAALTRDILVSFAPLAWAAQVTLREELDGECPAVIDAAAYRQIVLNLLENAVRYGPVAQTITIAVGRGDGVVRLAVTDEGPGIDVADRERIWAPFVRLRTARQGPLGTGIGLAVVRDLTLRHGGRAWVERAESGGARFIVELPATRRPAPKESGQDTTDPPRRLAL